MTDLPQNDQNGTSETEADLTTTPFMSNRFYEGLRTLVQILLPGFGTLYGTLGTVWGWPATEQTVSSIAAVTLFLGLIVALSRRSYNKSDARYDGVINVTEAPEGHKQAALILRNYENPAEVVNQKEVLFKVEEQ